VFNLQGGADCDNGLTCLLEWFSSALTRSLNFGPT
jgi:hypothetical protein